MSTFIVSSLTIVYLSAQIVILLIGKEIIMYDSKEELPVSTVSIQTAVSYVYSTTNDVSVRSKSPRYSHLLCDSTSSEEMKTSGIVQEDSISTPVISNRPPCDNPPLLCLPFSGVVASQAKPNVARIQEERYDARNKPLAQFSSAQDDPILMPDSILKEWKLANGNSFPYQDRRHMFYFSCSERLPTLVDLVSCPNRDNECLSTFMADLARYGLESIFRLVVTATKNQIKRSLYQERLVSSSSTIFSNPFMKKQEAEFLFDGPWSRITRQAFGLAEMRSSCSTPPSKSSHSVTGQDSIRNSNATVVGIPNYGQTCFFNAVIQALAALEPFAAYLERMVQLNVEQRHYLTTSTSETDTTAFSLNVSKPLLCQDMLYSLKSVNGQFSRVDPRSILSQVGQKHTQFRRRFGLVTGEQQDAQELLQALLGMIIDEGQFDLTRIAVPSPIVSSSYPTSDKDDESSTEDDDSLYPVDSFTLNRDDLGNAQISKAMQIVMMTSSAISPSPLSVWCGSAIICATCRKARPIQNVPFLDIPIVPLAISQRWSSHQSSYARGSGYMVSSCRLEDCLEEFTSIERVHDVECRNCTIQERIQHYESEKAVQLQIIQGLESRRKTLSGRISGADDECAVVREELMAIEARIQKLQHLSPDDDTQALCDEHEDDGSLDPASTPKSIVLKRSDAFKCLLLTRLPSVLAIHVQRRYYDPSSGKTSKTMQHVAFPEILNVAPYCAYGGTRRSTAPFTGSLHSKEDCSPVPIWYKIMAVIEHRGGPYSGHYVCYRRDPSGLRKRWFWISDDKVRVCQWADVQKCQAYMLFYEAM